MKTASLLTEQIVRFCRFLRANGFPLGVRETADALQAAREVGLTDRTAVKYAWTALLCSSPEECELFNQLFEYYWNPANSERGRLQPQPAAAAKASDPRGVMSRSMSVDSETVEPGKETTGASALERIKGTDFSALAASDLQVIDEIAFRLWKQMSLRLIRRWKRDSSQGQIDLRRTIRASIGRGGEPLDLRYKNRQRKKIKLVVLLDVSGSMEIYSMFFLRFLYALHKYFKRVDSFVFSTRLTEITRAMRTRDLSAVIANLAEQVTDFAGGTRIGDCLQEFNRRYASKILTRNSPVLILSDGWDTGNPELLKEQLRAIKGRSGKLIWLNPLLGSQEYRPISRGMAAALPLADVFAPAHNLQSLLDLEKHFYQAHA